MDVATLVISHHVLSRGCVRETSRTLNRPVSSVSAAFARFQSYIAKPLTKTISNRIMPTFEGQRLTPELQRAANLVLEIVSLRKGQIGEPDTDRGTEQVAARSSISLLSLFRFPVVVHTGSIRSAALKIGIGQPQLTRQIKTLENELGVELLLRTTAGTVPTEAGRRLLALAQDLEAIWQRIFDHADERFRNVAMTTRFGSIAPLGHESHIAKILALLAARWQTRLPRRPLFISSSNAEELISGLRNRQYDLVLLDTADVPPGIEHCIVSRSGLALVGREAVIEMSGGNLRNLLLSAPLAVPSLKSGLRQKFMTLIEETMTPEERRRISYVEIDSIPVIANLVIEHGHITLLPLWALRGIEQETRAILLPGQFDIPLCLAWNSGGNSDAAVAAQRILMEGGRLGGTAA